MIRLAADKELKFSDPLSEREQKNYGVSRLGNDMIRGRFQQNSQRQSRIGDKDFEFPSISKVFE